MIFSSKYFDINAKNKSFVTEISDLPNFGNDSIFHSYPATGCYGITLVSEKTKEEAQFYVVSEDRTDDVDCELTGWRLQPTPRAIELHPRLKGWSMLIIND